MTYIKLNRLKISHLYMFLFGNMFSYVLNYVLIVLNTAVFFYYIQKFDQNIIKEKISTDF